MTHSTKFQDDLYGVYFPMNVKQGLSYCDPAGIPLNEAEVPRSGVTPFTRPLQSDSALLGGQNWRKPATRYTADTAQISGMSFCLNYYDQSELSAPTNTDIERPMNIQNFHQGCFPSSHQAQPSISMQSSDLVELSPYTSSFDGFEHTMGVSSSYPHQSTISTQDPCGTLSSAQGGNSSGSTRIYESAPAVGFSRGAHDESGAPTMWNMCTVRSDQVQPTLITSYFEGYEHTMGISSSSSPDQPTVFNQSPCYANLQPSIGISSPVQEVYSSGASCIYESDPSIDGISSGDWDDPRWSTDTNPNELSAAFCESSMVLCPLQSDHYQYPTVETPLVVRAPPQSSELFCHFEELKVSESLPKNNIHDVGIARIENSMKHRPIDSEETKTFECPEFQKKFAFCESSVVLCPLQSHHRLYPTVQTTMVAPPPEFINPPCQSNELQTSESSFDSNTRATGIAQLRNSTKRCPLDSEKTKTLECPECPKKFANHSKLRRRSAVHTKEKPFNCNECDRKFCYKKNLTTHWDRIHCGWKPYVCEKCDQKFRYASILETHYRKVHHLGVDRVFKCGKCRREFHREPHLQRHYNSVHLDIKPFECIKCGRKFNRKDNLKVHCDRLHLGLKLIECEACARSFYSNNELKKHFCNEASG